ncbi:MAG TPA: hypothetical protein DCQ53_00410, partial [Alphaproteobacteria bacterium]|nr:hypothetical protein [Alphaproteobacteria bacterium]
MTMFARNRLFTIAALASATALAACGGGNDAGQNGASGPRTSYERATDHAIGSTDAPLTIVEYSSVACPHCRDFHEEIFPMIESDYVETGQVRFVYREMLTGSAPIAMAGFMLTRCVPDDEYIEMIDLLFQQQIAIFQAARQPGGARAELLSVARSAGLSEAEFDACLNNQEHRQSVRDAHDQAIADGIDSTPRFIINGELLETRRSNGEMVYYWGGDLIEVDGAPVPGRMDEATFRTLIDY